MSQRKLLQEIDRVFKKVKEGLDDFDYIYIKLQDCDNQSQKEKLEADLKKEIKKLQRSREQIKNWMSGTEVKDKKPLIEHRKLIEREMERFKEVEKMMKTKAFSNEALASTNEVVDPKKKEKMEAAEFIEGNIEELQIQMESMEAQIDQISSTMKKKKLDSSKQSQIAALQETLTRHKWHISKLESILRHLENDNIDVEQINDIKEDIEYYVESNQDPNFIEDDTFYETLGLDDMEDSFAVIPGDEYELNNNSRSHSVSDDVEKEKEKEKNQKELENLEKEKETEKQKQLDKGQRDKKEKEKANNLVSQLQQTSISSPSSTKNALPSTSTTSTVLLNGGFKPATPVGTPKIKYATAVLSGIKKSNTQPTTISPSTHSTPLPVSYASLASSVQQSNVNNSSATPSISSSPIQQQNQHSKHSSPSQSTSTVAIASQTVTKLPETSLSSSSVSNEQTNSSESSTHSTDEALLKEIEHLASVNASRILDNTHANNEQILDIQKSLSFLDSENYNNLPKGINSYVEALESAKNRLFEFKKPEELHVPSKKSQPPPMICDLKIPPMDEISVYLESSLLNCPDSFDSDKPHHYIPTNPYITQPSFPIDQLPEAIGSTKFLEKVSLDTLFYGFYYNNIRLPSKFSNFHNLEPNSDDEYLQFIMAKELHRRGWKYQASSHTWFNENDAPENSANIFDFRKTWMARTENNFKYDANTIETGYYYNL